MSDPEQEAHWLDRNQDYWQARAEAAERERDEHKENAEFILSYANNYKATLAAVREEARRIAENWPTENGKTLGRRILAILDGEGES